MNGRGYRGRYRRGQRRGRILPLMIIILITFVVLFLVFLFVGNSLNDKTEGAKKETSQTEAAKEAPKAAPASVGCYRLDIEGAAAAETANNIAKLSSSGALAVSLEVKGANNELLYSSRVASAFGKQSGSTLDVATVVSRAKAKGMYVSAYFALDFMKESNSDIKAAKLGYEAALVSELANSGVDDVMVSCKDVTGENYTELISFANSVKAANKNAKIGVAIGYELYSSQNASVIIDSLYEAFDMIGIDLSGVEKTNAEKQIESALSGNLYYILRYNARVVLPTLDGADASTKLAGILLASNVTNFQYVK